jgi:hypothetical protein
MKLSRTSLFVHIVNNTIRYPFHYSNIKYFNLCASCIQLPPSRPTFLGLASLIYSHHLSDVTRTRFETDFPSQFCAYLLSPHPSDESRPSWYR